MKFIAAKLFMIMSLLKEIVSLFPAKRLFFVIGSKFYLLFFADGVPRLGLPVAGFGLPDFFVCFETLLVLR